MGNMCFNNLKNQILDLNKEYKVKYQKYGSIKITNKKFKNDYMKTIDPELENQIIKIFTNITIKEGSDYTGEMRLLEFGEPYEVDFYYENKNWVMHGIGEIKTKDDFIYKGGFKNGFANGYGEIIISDNEFFKGQFFIDYAHGKGVEENEYSIFKGNYLKGKKNGNGELTSKINNTTYYGNFSNNYFNLEGELRFQDNSIYKGNWKENRIHGKGIFELSDKSVFNGEFFNGKIHGKGIYTLPDKKVYLGEWNMGLNIGEGIFKKDNKEFKKGNWVDNKFIVV